MSFPRATALGLTFALATAALGQEEAPAPTPSLAGTVEDRDGYAVEGAVVIAYSPTASFDEPPLTARTDRNGRFQLELKDSPFWNVSVRATGHVPWSQRRVAPGAALRIVLQKGSHAIEGTVLDGHTLELIAGARVELLEGGRGFRLPPVTLELEPIATSTGEEGEFHFDGLSAARASVAATARGYGRSVRRDVAPGEPLQLFLFPGAALSGRVLIDDDTPLEGALVQALPESGRRFRMARGRIERTTKDSLFKLLGLASGRYHVLVRHEDLAPQIIPDVEIEKEATVELDVYLSPGTRISDRLVDEDERPITGRVAITTLDGVQLGMALGSEFVAPSDGEGVFVLPSLPRGRHDLNVVASGFVQQDVEVEISDKDVELDLGDIVLETGLAIRGYVVDKEDVAIPGAELRGFASMRRRVGARFGRDELKATTDADGSFVLAGLEPGHYGLFVQAPGYGFSGRELVEAGTDDVKLVLEPAGTIVGSIVDPDERPLLSVSVSVRPASRQGRGGAVFATSDAADDTFLIEDVVKGTYVLEVIAPDFLPEVVSNVDVTPGAETDVGQLQLRRGALVRRTVLDPSGQPVAGATVRANTPGEQRMAARDNFAVSDTDGFFSIEGTSRRTARARRHPSELRRGSRGRHRDPRSDRRRVAVGRKSGRLRQDPRRHGIVRSVRAGLGRDHGDEQSVRARQ